MSVEVDVHPDDLLHRARVERALTRDERLHLEAHLRDCSTCRFVRDAGRAFDGEATEAAPAHLEGLVDQTMQRLRAGPGRARRPQPRRLAAGAMTVVVLIGGVAFAGYWGARHPGIAPAVVAPHATSAPVPRKHRAATPAPTRVDAAPTPVGTPAPIPIPIVDRAPQASASRGPAPAGRRLALARPADDGASAARLFEAANRARRRGDVGAAEAAYGTLWTKFRASSEALTSRAIAGQWMLDRGQPRAAIPLFRQYLAAAPTGDLEEDVLVGLADAQDAIGESAAAAVTRRRLLAEHPESVHAGRARDGLGRSRSGTAP